MKDIKLASVFIAMIGDTLLAPRATLMAAFWILSNIPCYVWHAKAVAAAPYDSLFVMYAL